MTGGKKMTELFERRTELFKYICEQLARYKFSKDELTAEQRVDLILSKINLIEYAYLCNECCTILEMPCFINGECPECKSKSKEILYLNK